MSARPPPKPAPKPGRPPTPQEPEQAATPGWFPVTSEEFERRMHAVHRVLKNIDDHVTAVEEIVTQIGEQLVSTQADVDAIAAELTQEESDLNQAVTAIQTWINNQPASVDVSELQTLADGLKTSVSNAAALVPPTPPAA
jgi:hypothetical protein